MATQSKMSQYSSWSSSETLTDLASLIQVIAAFKIRIGCRAIVKRHTKLDSHMYVLHIIISHFAACAACYDLRAACYHLRAHWISFSQDKPTLFTRNAN